MPKHALQHTFRVAFITLPTSQLQSIHAACPDVYVIQTDLYQTLVSDLCIINDVMIPGSDTDLYQTDLYLLYPHENILNLAGLIGTHPKHMTDVHQPTCPPSGTHTHTHACCMPVHHAMPCRQIACRPPPSILPEDHPPNPVTAQAHSVLPTWQHSHCLPPFPAGQAAGWVSLVQPEGQQL
jgi:hypothetical protein